MDASLDRAAQSPWVERLARIGLIAQGLSFLLVAYLALELVLGKGGKATDREGALQTLADDSVGRIVVIGLTVGFGAYALWRLAQVFLGHDVEEAGDRSKWSKRISSLAKGAVYAVLCWAGVSILRGSTGDPNTEKKATAGVLGWPAGRWIVFAVAAGIAAAALWNFYRGVSLRFRKQLKTNQMSHRELKWTTRVGVLGLLARAAVFGLIAWFFFRAAAEYDANKATGLDGALQKLLHEPYGKWLLGIVATGLAAFGVFCLIQSRYREV
jgi:hypothetical protein